MWVLLTTGGYRLAESINTVLTIAFTLCLMACAALVIPTIGSELVTGLIPRVPPSEPGKNALLMIAGLAGIVMAGSGTVRYSAWAEEREMGLFKLSRRRTETLANEEIEPESQEEVQRMRGWLKVNRVNVILTYLLGFFVCTSTFVLGVGILRPAGVELAGPALARQLSLMMTEVWGTWARSVFYLGTWAAIISTAISVFVGSMRMDIQPLRRIAPGYFNPKRIRLFQKAMVTVLMLSSWIFYTLLPEPTVLVILMGVVDAPLVGVLIITYAYLARYRIPGAYRIGTVLTVLLFLIGAIYLAFGLLGQLAKFG